MAANSDGDVADNWEDADTEVSVDKLQVYSKIPCFLLFLCVYRVVFAGPGAKNGREKGGVGCVFIE